jgi:hypothetical protein
MKTYAA